MLQEEFSRLIYLYQQASEGNKQVSLEELFRKSLKFVDHLKQQIKEGDAEDREAALKMMRELFSQMQKQTRIVCERAGMTEEEMTARSENPDNFTPEQWKNMQEAKDRLTKAGQELSRAIHESSPTQQKTPPAAGPAPPAPPEAGKPQEKKGKTPKKSGWMRS